MSQNPTLDFEENQNADSNTDINQCSNLGVKPYKREKIEKILKSARESNALKQLKSILIEWSLLTKFDCLSKIFEYENNVRAKVIWLLIFLSFNCLTFWLVSSSIIDFLKYEVVTKTEIVYETPSTFPTVTLCDNNPLTTIQAQVLLENITLSLNKPLGFLDENAWDITKLALMLVADPAFGDNNKQRLGLAREQFTWCYFNNQDCIDDLHWIYSYDFGNCFQFNSGLNKSNQRVDLEDTTVPGPDYGLQIDIGPLRQSNKYASSWSSGMIVFVHNSSSEATFSESVFVETGKWSYISVKRTLTHKEPRPYSECINLNAYSSCLYEFIVSELRQVYRQQDCFKLCIQERILENCGCYYLGYPRLNAHTRPCTNGSDLDCFTNEINHFDVHECVKNSCPLECDTVAYDLEWSSLVYPNMQLYNSLNSDQRAYYEELLGQNKTLSYEMYKSLFVNLNIFFPSLQFTQITESPKMSPIDLLAQIGGSLGMFLSLSLFTFVEVFECLILIVYALFFKKKET